LDLKGKLSIFDPATVFQMLNLTRLSGELRFKTERNSARIYFEDGNIIFAEIADNPVKIGQRLIDKGLIDEEQLERALRKKPKRKRIGKVLVADGAIEQETLQSVVVTQIKEVVYEVIRWRDGWFTFTSGKRPKTKDIFLDVPTDHLMLEGLKRMDEAGDHTG